VIVEAVSVLLFDEAFVPDYVVFVICVHSVSLSPQAISNQLSAISFF
jgi:hypothetical protein